MINNVHYVNNTLSDITPIFQYFVDAYHNNGVLHEDVSDIFVVKMLKDFNPDGTDRMMIFAA